EAVLTDLGLRLPVRHFGVLRSYATRHGAGPLPTEDRALDALAEPHNADEGFQGRFRRGHPDALLLRYALRAAGPPHGLCVSHMDRLPPQAVPLRWCEAYDAPEGRVHDLPWAEAPTLATQAALTHWLGTVRPRWAPQPLRSPEDWCAQAGEAGAPPVLLQG